jgi:magnesium transporter
LLALTRLEVQLPSGFYVKVLCSMFLIFFSPPSIVATDKHSIIIIMITEHRHDKLVWIDIESPTKEEIHEIMGEYSIHPGVAEELLLPTMKPKVEFYNEQYIYLILHFPAFRHTHRDSQQNQEVDFIIGKNFLITTRYDTIDPLHKFAKIFEVNSILDEKSDGEHAGHIFFYMIKKLYRALEHELDYMSDVLDEVESRIFEGKEKDMVKELSHVSRDLLNFKQAMSLHKEILDSFETVGRKFFGRDFSHEMKAMIGEYYRIRTGIHTNMDSLSELRETNNSLVSTKQNEVMKVLTIMAFVTFPLSLIASIFGMNTNILPIVGRPHDFWIIMGIMMTFAVLFFLFFKYKKWL